MTKLVAGAALAVALLTVSPAVASTEIGPCSDEDAIRVQVGTTATVCVHAVDSNECDANDIVIRVGGRTICVLVP